MAITLTNVSLHSAAFAPVEFTIDSNRHLSEIKAVSAIADSSGNTALTVSGVGTFEAGDVAVLTLGTTDFAYLNGSWDVVSVATNTIVINCPYQAASTGTKPTATRTNTGIKEKVVFKVGGVTKATFYVYPVLVGSTLSCSVDLSVFLASHFTSTFTLTPGHYDTTAAHKIVYSCSVYEMNYSSTGTYYTGTAVDLQTSGAVKNLIAHRTTVYRPCDLGSPNNLMLTDLKTQYFKAGDVLMVSGIVSANGTAYVNFSGNGVTAPPDSASLTVTNYWLHSVFGTDALMRTFTVKYANTLSDAVTWDTEFITYVLDTNCTAYPVTLYFLNRYGGFDIYHFKETDKDTFKVEKWKNKTMQNVTGTTREKVLIGRPETYANMKILRDLISSPEIYDTSGNRVYLKSTDMILKDGDSVVYPEITIEEFENAYING